MVKNGHLIVMGVRGNTVHGVCSMCNREKRMMLPPY
jgi:hypothetical protein